MEKHVEWARKYLNNNWNRTVFSDGTAFQLFRNTVQYWYKDKRPVRRIPKDKKKFLLEVDFQTRITNLKNNRTTTIDAAVQ